MLTGDKVGPPTTHRARAMRMHLPRPRACHHPQPWFAPCPEPSAQPARALAQPARALAQPARALARPTRARHRPQVGTAINIARACNILPSDANVVALTTEKFPVLADVSTAELLAIQRQIDKVKADPAAYDAGAAGERSSAPARITTSESALLPSAEPSWAQRLSATCGEAFCAQRRRRLLRSVLERELDRYTISLDQKYPALGARRAPCAAPQPTSARAAASHPTGARGPQAPP
eukprot:2511487-Prymnesium_polylepis.1